MSKSDEVLCIPEQVSVRALDSGSTAAWLFSVVLNDAEEVVSEGRAVIGLSRLLGNLVKRILEERGLATEVNTERERNRESRDKHMQHNSLPTTLIGSRKRNCSLTRHLLQARSLRRSTQAPTHPCCCQ